MAKHYVILPESISTTPTRRWRSALQALSLGLLLTSLTSCGMWDTGWNNGIDDGAPDFAWGMRPLYVSIEASQAIFSGPPQVQRQGTGFVTAGTRLYVVEFLTGVHVIDNTNPANPRVLAFINIPGVTTITASRDRLYADNYRDLVTIDITDPANVRVVDRDPDLYPAPINFPQGHIGFFECYDPSRGLLLGWEQANLERPECRL